jgi:hypothetical protein
MWETKRLDQTVSEMWPSTVPNTHADGSSHKLPVGR